METVFNERTTAHFQSHKKEYFFEQPIMIGKSYQTINDAVIDPIDEYFVP